MEHIITIISSVIGGGVVGTLVGIFTEKQKRKAETDLLEADLLEKMEASYDKLVSHFNKKIDELLAENESLKREVKELREELKKHKIS